MQRPRRPILVALAGLVALTVTSGALPSGVAAASRESRLAAQLLVAINGARAGNDLGRLRSDTALVAVARWRSSDMAKRGYFGHEIPPNGRLVFSELDRRGYCYVKAGENIGWNVRADTDAATAIHELFLASPRHREIELGEWSKVGVGVSIAPDGKRYWTVLFSRPCG